MVNSGHSSTTPTPSSNSGSNSYPGSSSPASDEPASGGWGNASTPRNSSPPAGLLADPDQWGDSCNGYVLPGSSAHVGRGTTGTSCKFAVNVLQVYMAQPNRFAGQTLQIEVASPRTTCPDARKNASPAPSTAIVCSGDDFLMTCTPEATNSWVACRGGNRAEVYVW
jgi:hypothetical protein